MANIPNQKFEFMRILVFRDEEKLKKKKKTNQQCQNNIFRIILMMKSCKQIGKKDDRLMNGQVEIFYIQ